MSILAPEEESEAVPKYLQEDEGNLTPECRSLLRTLPSEKWWITPHLYLYHGFWYPAALLNGTISIQNNFKADHSDILLATTPKAGTTWLKALLFALLNRSRYNNNDGDHPLLHNNPHDLVPFLELTLYHEDKNILNLSLPRRLFNTHIPFSSLPSSVKSSGCKIVYLCRNPKDTFISLWHFSNKIRPKEKGMVPLEDAFDTFCHGISACGPFWDHVLEYWKASQEMPHNVLFLKYEEIKEQPREQLRRLANFLGCPFSQEEEAEDQVEEILKLCSFKSLSGLEVNRNGKFWYGIENKSFFRQGKVGDWVNYLSEEMVEKLDRITEEKLHGSNLKL